MMRITIVFALVAIMASVAAAAPPTTPEATKTQARALYEEGTRHYNLNEFQDALTSFKEAYRIYPEPTFLFNIAQCQRQLGRKQDAVLSYRAFLRESPDAPNRGDVESLIKTLESAIREDAAARVAPLPPTPPVEDAARAAENRAAAERRARTLRLAGIGVGAVGVAALAAGIGLAVTAKHDADTISSADKSSAVYDPAVYSQGNTFNAAGIALISVGAAAAVAGTIMIVVGARHRHESVASASSRRPAMLTVGF